MNLSAVKKFVFIAISAFLIESCNINELEFDNLEVQPITGIFSFPLGEARYVLRDLMDSQTDGSVDFQEDSTSLLTLIYYDTITYNTQDDFVQIGDINESGMVTVIPVAAGPTTVNFSESFPSAYDPQGDEELDSLYYATGDLTINVNTDINATVNYTFTIPNTVHVNTGASVSLSGTIVGGGNDTQSTPLNNYKTLLVDPSGDNSFDINLDVQVTLGGAQNLSGAENFSFDLTYSGQTFSLVYGKFGQDTVQVGNQSIEIDYFTQAERDGITFGNPSLSFDFRNSFGIPVAVDFAGLNGVDGDGNRVFLTGDVVNNPPIIEGSDINTPTRNNPGETAETVVTIDRTNSNLVNVLASSPDSLVFDVQGVSNPESTTDGNYLQPTSQILAYVQMEIPMEVQFKDFKEDGSFGFGDGLSLDNVDSVFIRLVTLNNLPFNGTVDLAVMSEGDTLFPFSSTYVDSVAATGTLTNAEVQALNDQRERFTNLPVITAPFINTNGEVTDPNGLTRDIPLTADEVASLNTATELLITMTLNTPVSQTSREIYVKILADYTLSVKVGVGGRFNLDL